MPPGFSQGQDNFQQAPGMQFSATHQAHQPVHQPFQQNQHPSQQAQQQGQQYPNQDFQRAVYLPPRDGFRARNPTCFWVLMIIIALIVITIISSSVTYLMVAWQVIKIRDADWDRQYGPDRWVPVSPKYH